MAWAQLQYQQAVAAWRKKKTAPAPVMPLPLTMPTVTVNDMTIDAVLTSAQGYFNLNNVTQKQYIPRLAKLIQTVDPHLDSQASHTRANATAYFIGHNIDPDQEHAYTQLTPAYRPSHRLFVSPSEWRLVHGISADVYTQLAPYLIALPKHTRLNPNTASIPVLISYGCSTQSAEAIVHRIRNQGPFDSIETFSQLAGLNPDQTKLFTLQNQYLILHTTVHTRQINRTIDTILTVDSQSAQLVLLQQVYNP